MANDEWRTPEWVWKPYVLFDLDVAATAENTLAPKFITKEMDALTADWRTFVNPFKVGRNVKVWCNPPYSQKAGPLLRWCKTFGYWSMYGFHTISLLPADTSTKWFHWILRCQKTGLNINMTFLERRVRHIDPSTMKPGGSPKFGSLIVEFIP